MTPGIYSTVSALSSRWTQQDVSARNISNAASTGYKREVSSYGSFGKVLNSTMGKGAPVAASPTTYSQPTTFDLGGGDIKPTGAPLDAAIVGDGYFEVQTGAGPRLTRSGHFSLSTSRTLIDEAGHAVLGQSGPITLPPGDATIQSDGSLVVNGAVVDKLKVMIAKDPKQLTADGGTLFSTGNSQLAQAPNVKLAVGHLESSNVQLPVEMVQMIQNQRSYDMLTKMFQVQDESYGKAIQDVSGV